MTPEVTTEVITDVTTEVTAEEKYLDSYHSLVCLTMYALLSHTTYYVLVFILHRLL